MLLNLTSAVILDSQLDYNVIFCPAGKYLLDFSLGANWKIN